MLSAQSRQYERRSVAVTIVAVALLSCLSAPSGAQVSRSPAPRDTAGSGPSATEGGVQQVLTFGISYRGYHIGDTAVSERGVPVSYELSATRLRFQLDATSLRYAAPASAIAGNSPLSGRLELISRRGDTLALVGSSGSRPAYLDAVQAAALGAAPSATIPLEAFSFGTPPMFGAHTAVGFTVGEAVLSLRGGVESEPRPAGTLPVYWRGTTLLGGATLTGDAGDTRLSAGIDYSRSSGDSLGGRNLFPGGGELTALGSLAGGVTNPFDDLGDDMDARLSVFVSHPFGDARNDQPNLLVPLGNTMGATGSLAVPNGIVVWSPSLDLTRESSAWTRTAVLTHASQRNTATAWVANLGLDAIVTISSFADLTPRIGYAVGSVDASVSQSGLTARRGRPVSRSASFTDAVRGWWTGMELSVSW